MDARSHQAGQNKTSGWTKQMGETFTKGHDMSVRVYGHIAKRRRT